ncbi:chlorophyll a-b binding protein [Pycnococcus provasolii]|uniref:Chlorophyll a-b binding protein, chloroplastic n=1 Tax=Pycnococcus provasolii TaxID=41880 RepID=A0A830HUP9_9CHLO|nr:chlorophyll a-b binding protein [Pycnococcus provasolii]
MQSLKSVSQARNVSARATKRVAKKTANVNRTVWLPGLIPPAYLDGSLPGDAGFDPFGLSKKTEYLLVGLDNLDQNKAVNKAGGVIGRITPAKAEVQAGSLTPYNEVFGIERFRECELIHGRWAMLGVTGAVVAEAVTGINWVEAGAVENAQSQYAGLELPLDTYTLTVIEVLTIGYIEFARNGETDLEKRQYPGGAFDPFGLAGNADADKLFQLKTAELKHGRASMVAMLALAAQALNNHPSALNRA